jgi:hypothetical protein
MTGIIVLAVGMSGLAIFPSIISQPSQDLQTTETGHMLGHVTLVHKDSRGNIVQYLQGDNIIVNHGDDCALQGVINGTSTATTGKICGTTAVGFFNMGLGNSTTAAAKTDTKLGTEMSSAVGTCCGLGRAAGTTVYTASASNSNNGAKVVLTHTFTSTVVNVSGIAISEAGLFNSTTQGAVPMTAHQVFPTITLANLDTLGITWTITLN